MLKEFKEFITKGNAFDMAIGIIIGIAFGAIINSLVSDIIMPPLGLLLGRVDFSNLYILLKAGANPGPYASLADAQAAGAVTINYGLFVVKIIAFLIIGFVIFLLVRTINRMRAPKKAVEAAPTTKDCSHCHMQIPINATRCPYCTSELEK
jgi:large conductance mechanosensitive channel